MNRPLTLLVIAGEVSGDMHAAGLLAALRRRNPAVTAFGIGGDRLRAAGMTVLYDVRDMAAMGFTEVLGRFPFFYRVFGELLRAARERRPDAVLLVDYPGFNLRLAARAHNVGLRVIYYVCPQVWAWNRRRIPKLARCVDRLITIFPFEARWFANTNLRVDYVGHPLVEEIQRCLAAPPAALSWPGEPRVALLPGSRRQEIAAILPVLWRAAGQVAQNRPGAGFLIPAPTAELAGLVRSAVARLSGGPPRFQVVEGLAREVLRQAQAAMVASGTATLEAALLDCPMVVVYRTAPLTYLLGRALVRIPDIGMVNIVAERRICPEFVQGAATPTAVAEAILPLLDDTPARMGMLTAFREVRERLGPPGASDRAAALVLKELGREPVTR